jgi:large subunit ribosomal protein L24
VPARGRAVSSELWRATARAKVAPNGAVLDQVEVQYGADDRAIKLTGTGQVSFGKGARIDAVMSARQIDLDRAFVLPEGTRRVPLAVLRRFAESFGGVLAPPLPVRLGVGIDSILLAGAMLQNVRGDFFTDGAAWNLETVDFRAPGTTQVRAGGRLTFAAEGTSFTGPVAVESSDPKALLAWFEGRSDAMQGHTGTLRASGNITLGTEKIAVERLKAEIDRKAIAGRLAYSWAAAPRPARLDADLKAAELDIDQAIAFTRAALAGTSLDAPGEVTLALDIGIATLGGVEAKDAKAKFNFDSKVLVLERVAVADLGGAALDLNGRIDALATEPRGALTLDLDANRLDGVAAVLAKYVPHIADTVRMITPRLAPAKLGALLTVDRAESGTGSRAELAVTGKAGVARINISADATGELANIATAATADVNLTSRIYAEDGAGLIALLGLDKAIATEKRPASLTVTATGRPSELRIDARIAAAKVEGSAKGSLRLTGDDPVAGDFDLRLAAADALVLRRAGGDQPVPVTLRTRLAVKNGALAFENVSGVIAGAGIRGRLGVAFERSIRLDGRLETDALDMAAIVTAAAGMPARNPGRGEPATWSTEPFGSGALGDLAGQIAFAAQRASFSPTLAAQEVRGLFRFGDGEASFEDLEGGLGGGRFLGQLLLRPGPEGLAVRGRLALTDVDARAVIASEARPIVTGRLALQVEAEGSGLSPATLIGALRGAGTVTLEGAQLAGLDPKAFDAVIRAVDRGLVVDASKIKDMMEAGLQSGSLSVPRADGAFSVSAGQARWGNVVTRADGADLAISGVIDLSEWTLDARLTLSGPAGAPASAAARPDVFIALKGPLGTPKRTLDVSALAGWLTLRAVERQAKQLEMLETEPRQEATVGRNAPATAAVAPPESEIQPTPAPARATPEQDPQARPRPAPSTTAPASPRRSLAPTPPPEAAPALSPPIEIRPTVEPRPNQSVIQRPPAPNGAPKPRANGSAHSPADPPPAAARRSILDQLFGPQR